MTESALPTNHHGASAADSVSANGLSPTKPGLSSVLLAPHHEEEEDYTIKCICGFRDDDGNTVFCDRCETWQHTECYYFEDGEVPDVSGIDHWCADCNPRPLDVRGAVERQRMRRDRSEPGDRKVKKATTKSHKKKVRAPDSHLILTNGSSTYERNDHHPFPDRSGSPKEKVSSTKRPKPNHRYSTSLQSPNLAYGSNDKRSGSSSRTIYSPSKTPGRPASNGYLREPFSYEFMHLYDDDPGESTMQSNLFNDITITSSLSSWTQDAEALATASNGLSPQDIFHRCNQPLDSMGFPFLHKQYKQGDTSDTEGRCPRWTLLTTDAPLVKGSIVGELKGKIGHMRDYVQDAPNRWDYLRHPVPFVFFHPKLPIYIDTRHEGTRCRYLRRSCRPNLKMTTILENGSDYRFCFVATDDLDTGSELTIGWTLDQHIRNFFHRRSSEHPRNEGSLDADEEYVAEWVGKVLADFGGCACDSPQECSLAKYDRRTNSFTNGTYGLLNGSTFKGRNGYGKRHSPVMDQTARGGPIYVKQQDEDEDDRSTSGSARSKQRSGETTPMRNPVGENSFSVGLELSDREKRKIAALEKNFEQIEQDKNQPAQRRKKRNSGGSGAQTSATPVAKHHSFVPLLFQSDAPNVVAYSPNREANVALRTPSSPHVKQNHSISGTDTKSHAHKRRAPQTQPTPTTSLKPRPNYVSTSVQADRDSQANWYTIAIDKKPRKPFVSLSKQLLLRAQRDRMKIEEHYRAEARQQDYNINSELDSVGGSGTQIQSKEDIDMQDAPNDTGDAAPGRHLDSPKEQPQPLDIPTIQSEVASKDIKFPPPQSSNGFRTADLHVQLPPPVPHLGGEGSPGETTQGPGTVRPPLIQTPSTYPPLFSTPNMHMVQPSPVKKKVSLVEYMSRRSNRTEPLSAGDKPLGSSPLLAQTPFRPAHQLDESRAGMDSINNVVNEGLTVGDILPRGEIFTNDTKIP
ncbi:MAG: hypothetical protein Q9220_005892 [cf. Caloplaca sp. 1 TL-2023]